MIRLLVVLCLSLLGTLALAGEKGAQMKSGDAPAVTAEQGSAKAQVLSEQEAAELAKRAEEPGEKVTGGALSNLHLTYIVIALATAVIVLIAVS